MADRKKLIDSALRYKPGKKKANHPDKPIEELTSFKPFNVREIAFDVIDTTSATNDAMMHKFESRGYFESNRSG